MSDDRLRSLLTGGLSCPLGKPDLDLRRQIPAAALSAAGKNNGWTAADIEAYRKYDPVTGKGNLQCRPENVT